MAEVTALRNNVLPYPVYGFPFTVVFPILDADGDLVTGAAGLDSEISKNGDTFADCTNEATEIATSSGIYYLCLTATEMTTNIAGVQIKTSTSGAKTTVLGLYPRILSQVRTATAQAGAAGTITLDASASTLDDYYNGCVIYLSSGTGNGQSRVITDYNGTTKVATVGVNWDTNPSSDSVFDIRATDSRMLNNSNTQGILGTLPTATTAGVLDVNAKNINNVAATNVTAINANLGTTQPVNFTGTAGSALVKSDMVDVAGAAVNAATAQIGANLVNVAGSPVDPDAAQIGVNIVSSENIDFTVAQKTSLDASTPDVTGAVVEGSYTIGHYLKLMAAILFGKASGGGTTSLKFRDTGDTKDRVTATVDANGNRTGVTLDES